MEPIVRNLRFAIDDSLPKYWHGGRKSVTIFLNNLSVFFPAGERFFVRAVRAHQARVTDEELLKQVRAFCGQEAVHAREHERLNEVIESHGYPVREMERGVEALLGRVSARSSPIERLGVTCALEHFTALMGEMLLGDSGLLEGANPSMAALWRWHAAEENEHKTVAFDVFRAAGGGYGKRIGTMVGATIIFWSKVFEQQARMMKADGLLYSLREWVALFRFLFIDPGGMAPLFPLYFAYFRPTFHPSDNECGALLDDWRREYESSTDYALTIGRGRTTRAQPTRETMS